MQTPTEYIRNADGTIVGVRTWSAPVDCEYTWSYVQSAVEHDVFEAQARDIVRLVTPAIGGTTTPFADRVDALMDRLHWADGLRNAKRIDDEFLRRLNEI
jgi:hypothetical protein